MVLGEAFIDDRAHLSTACPLAETRRKLLLRVKAAEPVRLGEKEAFTFSI